MARTTKITWVLIVGLNLVVLMGSSSLLMASPSKSHATHFFSDKGPHLPHDATGCYVCHADGNKQCQSSPVFADDKSLTDTHVCDVCHSPGGAFGGVTMAKDNWVYGVYKEDGVTLQSGKELWCAGCHDIEPANSKADGSGINAPKVIGDDDTWGFYATGHGSHGLVECLECHDAGKTHIDHEHRTYTKASNNYQAGYRLKSVNGGEPMIIPRPIGDPIENWEDFALCFNCHNRNEVLGDDFFDVDHTNFWHDNDDLGGIWNSHDLHLQFAGLRWDSDWDGEADSTQSCVACHNVHGSTTPVMIRHGELISTYGTTDKVPALEFAYRGSGSTLAESYGGRMNMNDAQFIIPHPEYDQYNGNGVCDACHFGYSYDRPPYLHVDVWSPKAAPDMVSNDGGDSTLTVYVMYHGLGTVEAKINLSPIGGGNEEAMTDEGNGVFRYDVKDLSDDNLEGPVTFDILAEASDTPDTGATTITFWVFDPDAIYVDNTDLGASPNGDWGTSNWAPGYYGTNYHFHETGSGADTFTWTPTITSPGTFEVFAMWTEDYSRAPDATYTVYHDAGNTEVQVNQQTTGGTWNSLGTYSFDGVDDYVELVENADGYVIADAIKLVKVVP